MKLFHVSKTVKMPNYRELDDLIQTLVMEKNEATVKLLQKIINGVIQNPNVEKFRRLKVSGKAFSEKLLPIEGKCACRKR